MACNYIVTFDSGATGSNFSISRCKWTQPCSETKPWFHSSDSKPPPSSSGLLSSSSSSSKVQLRTEPISTDRGRSRTRTTSTKSSSTLSPAMDPRERSAAAASHRINTPPAAAVDMSLGGEWVPPEACNQRAKWCQVFLITSPAKTMAKLSFSELNIISIWPTISSKYY